MESDSALYMPPLRSRPARQRTLAAILGMLAAEGGWRRRVPLDLLDEIFARVETSKPLSLAARGAYGLVRRHHEEHFVAAVRFLQSHEDCTGSVGCVGFCYGGSVSNMLAVRIPDLACAVPFYGGWPDAAEAAQVNAPLLIHLAGLDERVNAGWPAYRDALDAAGKDYTVHIYDDVNHGFHNDTTARYDAEAAALAWERTLAFFGAHI